MNANGNFKGNNEPTTGSQLPLPGAPQYTNTGKGGYVASAYQRCFHGGTKPLWTLPNGHSIYAAQESELGVCTGHSVILDCTGYANKQTPQQRDAARAKAAMEALVFDEGAAQFEALRSFVEQPTARVHIAWPDGGEPPLVPAFWERFLVLATGSVCVCCFGSHGRTGTALAALYMAQHGPSTTDLTLAEVVATIRRKHCADAVETYDQVSYLESVADYYGVVVSDDVITGSYHTRPAVSAPMGFHQQGAQAQASRPTANGVDVATGIRTSVSVPVTRTDNGQGGGKRRRGKGRKGAA